MQRLCAKHSTMTLDMKKYGLALHTTSPQLGIALSNFAGDTSTGVWDLGRDLSTHLHQYLVENLVGKNWSDLGFIAVAKGPGGFTGTRIGVVTARIIAQQLNIPLFPISTLAAMAWSEKEQERAMAVQMEARRGQLFVAIYRVAYDGVGLEEYLPDTTMKPPTWEQTLANLEMPYQLIHAPVNLGATVSSILKLAYLDWQQGKRPHWSSALPFYGQHPVETVTSDQ